MGFRVFAAVAANVFCGLALTVSIVGCSLGTNDTPADKGPLKLTLPEEACLADQAIPAIQKYFESTASTDDVVMAWDCISGALTKFTTSTRGANPDYFTSREMRTFLETYYLADFKVSDPLLAEIMRMKQLLLGGTNDRLTKEELAQAQQIVLVLRSETLKLQPYIKYLMQKVSVADALANPAEAEAAINNFRSTIGILGSLLGRGTEAYTTDNLKTLLTELKPLFKDWAGPQQAIDDLPTFAVIKALVLNPPGESIAPAEWQPLMVSAGRVYSLIMRQHYLMANQDLTTGAGLVQIRASIEEVISIIQSGINAKTTKQIGYPEIDDTIDEMMRLGFIDQSLRDTTLKALVRTMFAKLLNPATSGARPKVTGLNTVILERIHTAVTAFLDMQARWDSISATTPGGSLNFSNFVRAWQALPAPKAAPSVAAVADLTKLFTLASPLTYRDNGTVVFDSRLSYLPMNLAAFTRYNWQSAATRMLVQGYATDAAAYKFTGLTDKQVQDFFTDVHDLGVDMQLFEPKDADLWQTSFNEANMFMLSAVNDDHMSYTEIFDYLAYLLGGGAMSKRMYNDALEHCAHVGVDGFNRPTMDINCFRARYGQKYASIHAELPWWVKTQADAGTSGWASMEHDLEAAARTDGFSDEGISTSDITRITMVQQYIESLFVRFDKNRDGVISYDEAQNALPIFKSVLAQALDPKNPSGVSSNKINGLFMYMLKNGKPPTSLGEKIYYAVFWLNSKSKWQKVTADRLKLLSVVGAVKAATAAKVATTAAEMAVPMSGVDLPDVGEIPVLPPINQ